MKKLGVFVCILVTSLSLFGSLSSGTKAFAAVTEADHTALKSYAKDIEFISAAIRMQSIVGGLLSNTAISIMDNITLNYLREFVT